MGDNQLMLRQLLEKMDETTSVTELQQYCKKMCEVRGFNDELIKLMLFLFEETGELAKEVRKFKKLNLDVDKCNEANIASELVDVFSYVIAIANVLDIDLMDEYKKKELINCERIWK